MTRLHKTSKPQAPQDLPDVTSLQEYRIFHTFNYYLQHSLFDMLSEFSALEVYCLPFNPKAPSISYVHFNTLVFNEQCVNEVATAKVVIFGFVYSGQMCTFNQYHTSGAVIKSFELNQDTIAACASDCAVLVMECFKAMMAEQNPIFKELFDGAANINAHYLMQRDHPQYLESVKPIPELDARFFANNCFKINEVQTGEVMDVSVFTSPSGEQLLAPNNQISVLHKPNKGDIVEFFSNGAVVVTPAKNIH